jgi:prepilin-type N-terminal cleavage/methylation domain-containing protein
MTRDRRRGFTLIELLVVMGIILLLVGIAVFSYQKLERVASGNATQSRLQTCVSIESEYEMSGNTNIIEGPSNPVVIPNGSVIVPPNPIYVLNQSLGAPGSVNIGAQPRYSTPWSVGSLGPPATGASQDRTVVWTSAIMQIYAQVPGVQSTIAQLPTAALLPTNPDVAPYVEVTTGNTLPSTAPPTTSPPPNGGIGTVVIVDAWKNPIIYVPSGGLSNVWIGGTVPPTGVNTATGGPWAHPMVVRSIDHRPFWASAGPDGIFSQGDDNLYSCPVVYSTK